MMDKIDLKKTLKALYTSSAKAVAFVDVPEMSYLMIDGTGDPNTAQMYKDAVATLYTAAYGVKFAAKKALGMDYTVMPLEGLWWVEDLTKFSYADKSSWHWTMLNLLPDGVTAALVEAVMADVLKKKNPPLLELIRFERYAEGRAAQIMHLGSYADEPPTIARLHDAIIAAGYAPSLKHHEIYLSDARKTAPEKLKTIIRQPVTAAPARRV